MFIQQVVTLALASSALAQMSGMPMDHGTVAEHTTAAPVETAAETIDSAMPTSVPAEATILPATEDATSDITSMPMDYTLSTSTTGMANMPHGTGGMTTPNSTATAVPEPPISGSSVSGVSVALFAVSIALGTLFQL